MEHWYGNAYVDGDQDEILRDWFDWRSQTDQDIDSLACHMAWWFNSHRQSPIQNVGSSSEE